MSYSVEHESQADADESLDIKGSPGKFTAEIFEEQSLLLQEKRVIKQVVNESWIKPSKDAFINYMAFQAGLLDFSHILSLADLRDL